MVMRALLKGRQSQSEPYCTNCDYTLTGLTESPRCPECGKPLVEVLARRGATAAAAGYRFRSKARLFGVPVVDVARGPWGRETTGRAKGLIAIGDVATGVIAIGGVARGVFALGGLSVGGVALGGMSIGVLGLGGCALAAFAMGGAAIGLFSSGGGALGAVAQGGAAAGYMARGGNVKAAYEVTGAPTDAAHATAIFDAFSWFFGTWPNINSSMFFMLAAAGIATLCTASLIVLASAIRNRTLNDLFVDEGDAG